MRQNQTINSSISIFKWTYIDNVFNQIGSGHKWIILFSFPNSKNCTFHISFNKASWCKNMIACKCRRQSGENLIFFCMYFHALIQFIICLQKLFALFGKGPACSKFHILPKENFASASPSKMYVPYINMTIHSFVNSLTYG